MTRRDQARQKKTNMLSSPTDQLFKQMRVAIKEKKYEEMQEIILDPRYSPDAVGLKDSRTNLHTASELNDSRAINVLLGQRNIDPNVGTSDGITPLMIASKEGNLEALEALLADVRVDLERIDDEDKTAKKMLPKKKEIKRTRAMKLFEAREQRGAAAVEGEKVALLIGNSHYKVRGLTNLPGAERDVTKIETLFKTSSYIVKTVMNSEDIITDITDVMKDIPSSSIQHFQFFYAGKASFYFER